jgi:hypothetical protein
MGTATAAGDGIRLDAHKSWVTSAREADSYSSIRVGGRPADDLPDRERAGVERAGRPAASPDFAGGCAARSSAVTMRSPTLLVPARFIHRFM